MTKIKLKPLSINDAHIGRHFPTPEMKSFKEACILMLPKPTKVYEGKLEVYYEFGLSSKNADWDNFIKMFQDCLAAKFGFNDRQIYLGTVRKVDVNKGEEYIKFEISPLPTDLSTNL